MIQKDYRAIANVLAKRKPNNKDKSRGTLDLRVCELGLWGNIRNELIEVFEADNPDFDRRKFIDACNT